MQSEILKREGEGQKVKKAGDRQRQTEVESLTWSIFKKGSQISKDWMWADEVSKARDSASMKERHETKEGEFWKIRRLPLYLSSR